MNDKKKTEKNAISNTEQQAVDKAPGEERDKGEKVTAADLKGKKVDADPEKKRDQPA